ncbi:L-dopachrome tautomerase-related protein [Siphonobacter aquaeclarae]|uniref:Sugar lactone lactonase YvrE n=1 Tax=Siphonobacter aquaeclarae TaxID=563176 RepID=A0A1G9R163_9BACT|nr:L-dopachrome tautomerase-related protein [Siphonobacter aquaeclarae]SDM16850.1 Sugar lactone lactonase YvrE [Siphonobacter aquaeclarae]
MKKLLVLFLVAAKVTAQQQILEEVARFGRYQPVGLAISHEGRTFVSFPHWTSDYRYGLIELLPDGTQQPYPNEEWSRAGDPKTHFVGLQALYIDASNTLWALDTGVGGVKLLRINIRTNTVERVYAFEDIPASEIGLNDVNVDAARNVAFFSDPRRAALVVLDLKTGKSRTVLKGHPSTTANPAYVLKIDGREVRETNGKPFSSNANGIALTKEYFYFRPITQTRLFRVPVEVLVKGTDAEIAAAVEVVGEVGISHGMFADADGNIYMGDSEKKTLYRWVASAGQTEVLVQDERILWPDSFAISPDGYLYVTAAQLQRAPRYNGGEDRTDYPFRLYRVKLPLNKK